MAEARRQGSTPQLEIEQILVEAQHRWLRPTEICEILRNHRNFHIAPEPPNKPPSGSLFLFDRKVLRYFRKDGHNWRKKKDGKTVKEAHERLKAESVDVLHCYYAHGEDNENFQRRSYWMLEEDLMHIVLVHYLEVKGNKTSFSRTKDVDEITQAVRMNSPVSSSSFTSQNLLPSQNTDVGSPNSTQTSEYEDAESDNYQTSARYYPYPELQQYDGGSMRDVRGKPCVSVPFQHSQYGHRGLQVTGPDSQLSPLTQEDITKIIDPSGLGLSYSGSRTQFDLTSWDKALESSGTGFHSESFQPSLAAEATDFRDPNRRELLTFSELFNDDPSARQVDVAISHNNAGWQISDADLDCIVTSDINVGDDLLVKGATNYPSLLKQASLDLANVEGEGLKKYDSFSRWMSKELGDVDGSYLKSSSEVYWNPVESERVLDDSSMTNQEQLDGYLISPSLSQDQLFSITDFSPSWAYSGMETEVLISGTFLKSKHEIENCKWSCMFGEVEVPAYILSDGILSCHSPPHRSGRVPFYVTCSDRLARSEVREFEFRVDDQRMETTDSYGRSMNEIHLHMRLEKLLSLESIDDSTAVSVGSDKGSHISRNFVFPDFDVDDEWIDILKRTDDKELFPENAKNLSIQDPLKQKLHAWLRYKGSDNENHLNVLDKEGQGVLHLAAALGYDWAIDPIIDAGVSINFRDVRGWTALHWAASCGRERTVVYLVSHDASPGALTDPTPESPSGRTPADLASGNGHKGIAGFLAETSLTSHLSTLTLKDSRGIAPGEVSGVKGIESIAELSAIQASYGDVQGGLSLKDSLSAVRNAAQAAARIHQVFRMQSFQRKKQIELGNDKSGLPDERALVVKSTKISRVGQHNSAAHVAATRIQNKFRGWKGRKEFLIIRQRIVKIQAHVRGHQVRKHYKKIVWSVGIVEKVILRWRRKGSGLRGFRSEGLIEGPTMNNQPPKEDYDFLKEGRKQTEARLEKALARVKSMVQYPEARDQYRRLLNIVTELQESKVMQDDSLQESEEVPDTDFMIELEELWEDDTPLMLPQ